MGIAMIGYGGPPEPENQNHNIWHLMWGVVIVVQMLWLAHTTFTTVAFSNQVNIHRAAAMLRQFCM
jgi:hypothetical protein